jgi:hypothetical protein
VDTGKQSIMMMNPIRSSAHRHVKVVSKATVSL